MLCKENQIMSCEEWLSEMEKDCGRSQTCHSSLACLTSNSNPIASLLSYQPSGWDRNLWAPRLYKPSPSSAAVLTKKKKKKKPEDEFALLWLKLDLGDLQSSGMRSCRNSLARRRSTSPLRRWVAVSLAHSLLWKDFKKWFESSIPKNEVDMFPTKETIEQKYFLLVPWQELMTYAQVVHHQHTRTETTMLPDTGKTNSV